MLNKRGQGLSVHTIIVAIIGLIILVAIILMLTGKLGAFGEGAETQVTAGETLWTQLGWGGGEEVIEIIEDEDEDEDEDDDACCQVCASYFDLCITDYVDTGYMDCSEELASCELACSGC